MPGEEVGALLKVIELGWEVGKTLYSPVADLLGKSPYRILESFTTLELEPNGDGDFVQDRVVRFTKNHEIPSFMYGGPDGTHTIDELIVDGTREPHNYVNREINPKLRIEFPRGRKVSATLRAHSALAYPAANEWYETHVTCPIQELRLVIIFPRERPPRGEVRLRYRPLEGQPWVDKRFERFGTRYTTRGRRAFYWETRGPKVGSAYQITWDW